MKIEFVEAAAKLMARAIPDGETCGDALSNLAWLDLTARYLGPPARKPMTKEDERFLNAVVKRATALVLEDHAAAVACNGRQV